MQTRHLLGKSSDITRAVIGRKSVLYQSTKDGAELKLSRQFLFMPDHFPLAFFFRELKVNFRNKRADK